MGMGSKEMTPKELIKRFIERDENAMQELNNWMYGPITESRRLDFLEGRVMDLCGVVMGLCKYIDEKEINETK